MLNQGVRDISAGYSPRYKESHLWHCQYKNHRADIETNLEAKAGYRFIAQLKLSTAIDVTWIVSVAYKVRQSY